MGRSADVSLAFSINHSVSSNEPTAYDYTTSAYPHTHIPTVLSQYTNLYTHYKRIYCKRSCLKDRSRNPFCTMSAPSLAVPSTENRSVHRLPSTEATCENIQMDPAVIVPPQRLMAPSKQSEIASSFETARRHFDVVATTSPDYTPPEPSVTDKCAFAFGM